MYIITAPYRITPIANFIQYRAPTPPSAIPITTAIVVNATTTAITVPAMAVTDAIATIPVIRPCAGLDKEEIVKISRAIETFDISVLPYDDCCTVFTPKHPNTRPTLEGVLAEEAKLDVEGLVDRAFETRTVIEIKP